MSSSTKDQLVRDLDALLDQAVSEYRAEQNRRMATVLSDCIESAAKNTLDSWYRAYTLAYMALDMELSCLEPRKGNEA